LQLRTIDAIGAARHDLDEQCVEDTGVVEAEALAEADAQMIRTLDREGFAVLAVLLRIQRSRPKAQVPTGNRPGRIVCAGCVEVAGESIAGCQRWQKSFILGGTFADIVSVLIGRGGGRSCSASPA
jgi:hypothetical protein